MTIRAAALRWLALTHRVRDGDIFTSRYYPATESWTGADAWWLHLPVHRLDALGDRPVHLLCETAPGARDFHYLRVPASYLHQRLAKLDRPGDGTQVSLFLSAEPATRFEDVRGAGRVPFASFLQPTT